MKAKYTMAILASVLSVAAWAQEDDDMYFNAKDRAVLNKSVAQVMARRYQEADQQAIRTNPVNPSDSYSGRGVNPEYGAQTRNGTTLVQDNPNYFVSSYQPKNLNSSLYGSNSYYNTNPYSYGYNNPYLGYNGFGSMGYSGFGSPYGMGMYSPYSSMGLGYGMGGMGSGWYGGMGYGMGYGMGSMFSPFGSYAGMGYGLMSMYNPYGMGYGYGYSPYYGYPAYGYSGFATAIEPNAVHGRHSVRSSTVNNYVDNSRGTYTTTSNGTTRSSQMGRSAQNNYYDQSWRSNPNNYSRSEYNNNNYNNGGNTRSSYNNNSWGNSRSSFDSFGSGSRGGFSGGGGGGFSGGGGGHSGGGGGGGGGHSRGRN